MRKFRTVKDYHALIPEEIRARVEELRDTIAKAAPQAELTISYNMPAFLWNGPVAYYAWYPGHIGFYPTGTPIPAFRKDLKEYKTSRGAIQFPLDRKIPKGLVTKIVKFKLKENQEKAQEKTRASSQSISERKPRPKAKAKAKA